MREFCGFSIADKTFIFYLGKDEVTGSNPVISSKRKPRNSGKNPVCVALLFL